jgi:hypothetical protein
VPGARILIENLDILARLRHWLRDLRCELIGEHHIPYALAIIQSIHDKVLEVFAFCGVYHPLKRLNYKRIGEVRRRVCILNCGCNEWIV